MVAGDPGSRAIKLAAHRRLADSACAEVAATHAWRALELAALTGDPATGELARAVSDAVGTRSAGLWLDLLELAAPTAATSERFAARGGLALRWAAAIAEQPTDREGAAARLAEGVPERVPERAPERVTERAIELWQRAAAT